MSSIFERLIYYAGQYPAILTSHLVNNPYILTEKAWSIKDLLFGFQENFSRATGPVVPGGQDSTVHLLSTAKVSFSENKLRLAVRKRAVSVHEPGSWGRKNVLI